MKDINTSKRKLDAIFGYIEKDKGMSKDTYNEIMSIKKTNFLNIQEFKVLLNKGLTDAELKENDIYHMVIPKDNLFQFQVLINLSDGIVSIPCYPIDQENEWELDTQNIETMNHSDLLEIKNFLEDTMTKFSDLIKDKEVSLITKSLGGKLNE